MSKPIFTLGLPGLITHEELDRTRYELERKLDDYHVLVYSHNGEDLIFQCFNDANYTEINHEELRQLIQDQIKL
jgi:hypothetical protein